MKLDESTIESRRIYDGKVVKFDVDTVSLPDGGVSTRECVHHNGGVAVLFVKDGLIALVRQFRYAYKEVIYEIPAGKREPGEEPAQTALRELKEETGYVAWCAEPFLNIYPTPGYTDEVIYIFLVEDAEEGERKLDEGEFVNLEFLPIDDVLKKIDDGEIKDSKTICAVYRYVLYRRNAER